LKPNVQVLRRCAVNDAGRRKARAERELSPIRDVVCELPIESLSESEPGRKIPYLVSRSIYPRFEPRLRSDLRKLPFYVFGTRYADIGPGIDPV
jgi:hypothetical protein